MSENVVEEAFGEAKPAVPDAAELEGAHIEAGGAELGLSLEKQLEKVIDGEPDEEEPVDNWVECSKCNEWRIVPSGQFLTFHGCDVKFCCLLVCASCHLVKKRRRA